MRIQSLSLLVIPLMFACTRPNAEYCTPECGDGFQCENNECVASTATTADGGTDGGGNGDSGTGNGDDCTNGDTRQCEYGGPENTRNVGICHAAIQACVAGKWGPCIGEVLPEPTENCNTTEDDNCDGDVRFGCPCTVGDSTTCGSDEGECVAGTQECSNGTWTPCNDTKPAQEICDNKDNDCDGNTDENVDLDPCYTGPAGTLNVGVCKAGTQTCTNGVMGACVGQTVPSTETCDGSDTDCDGNPDEDENIKIDCYTGPANTLDVGECHGGTRTCIGGRFGDCIDQKTPRTELCDNKDNNCDGQVELEPMNIILMAQSTTKRVVEPRLAVEPYTGDSAAIWIEDKSSAADILNSAYIKIQPAIVPAFKLLKNAPDAATEFVAPRVALGGDTTTFFSWSMTVEDPDPTLPEYNHDGRNVHVRWAHEAGQSWANMQTIGVLQLDSLNSAVSADGAGNALFVFREYIEGTRNFSLYGRRFGGSANAGTLLGRQRLSTETDVDANSVTVVSTASHSDGEFSVVWVQGTGSSAKMYIRRYYQSIPETPMGWSNIAHLETGNITAIRATSILDNGNIHIVWTEGSKVYSNIYAPRASLPWNSSNAVEVADLTSIYDGQLFVGASEKGALLATWSEFEAGKLRARSRHFNGTSWSSSIAIFGNASDSNEITTTPVWSTDGRNAAIIFVSTLPNGEKEFHAQAFNRTLGTWNAHVERLPGNLKYGLDDPYIDRAIQLQAGADGRLMYLLHKANNDGVGTQLSYVRTRCEMWE